MKYMSTPLRWLVSDRRRSRATWMRGAGPGQIAMHARRSDSDTMSIRRLI